MKSKRQEAREQRQRKQRIVKFSVTAGLILVAGLIGYVVWGAAQPPVGESVAIMGDISHVEDGTDPGPYNSNPPTSGRHYPTSLTPGFYDTNVYQYPEGYLVHNLEHGYVIFWYNCSELETSECEQLKGEVRLVLEAENNNKVIAYPRETIEEPVVLTSWGQLLRMEAFDADAARSFVARNRNKAPEPNAP
jgi:hypothetical protein